MDDEDELDDPDPDGERRERSVGRETSGAPDTLTLIILADLYDPSKRPQAGPIGIYRE